MPIHQKITIGLLAITLFFGGALFYRMVDHMATMTKLMGRIADDVSTMSQEITSMNREFSSMHGEVAAVRESVEKMEGHIANMKQPFSQGPEQLKKVLPMPSMDMFPGQR